MGIKCIKSVKYLEWCLFFIICVGVIIVICNFCLLNKLLILYVKRSKGIRN